MTAAVDTHADRFLYALHCRHRAGSGDPVVRVESKPIFSEQCARSFLLHGVAVDEFGPRGGSFRRICGRGDWRRLLCYYNMAGYC
jgi:hypothetical protein